MNDHGRVLRPRPSARSLRPWPGYNLVATVRSTSKLDALAAEAPDRVLVQRLDVTIAGDAEAALAAARARFGQIDVLINNAGYGIVGALEETPDNELRAQMETNFFGAWGVTKAALPLLRAQGAGAIVNISSLGGNLSFAGFSAYSASKFALEGMSETLAGEMTPFGVKVLIVEPGQLRTAFAADALRTCRRWMPMPKPSAKRDPLPTRWTARRPAIRTGSGTPSMSRSEPTRRRAFRSVAMRSTWCARMLSMEQRWPVHRPRLR
jgi:NAD(P)-dependent dehydrogenase (short-subunit alcohol dehydrogenase family)